MSDNYYYRALHRQRWKRARQSQRRGRQRALAGGWIYAPTDATTTVKHPRGKNPRPFVGIDGEGGGTNAHGQQHYRLLRAGEHVLFNNNKPLSTIECLNWILELPAKPIYVGFAFGYDSTMILRDLPAEYVAKLFTGERGYTYWRDFAIDYLPGHYLRISRVRADNSGVIPGASRTIWETWGFFQSKFTKALERWTIGDKALLAKMEQMKAQRGGFIRMSPRIIEYNGQECRWLADLMEKFRERSIACELVPRTWNGPGKTAAALLKRHNVIRRERVLELLPPDVLDFAQRAYCGGRAELAWVGVLEACWSYDIRSAYPAAMLEVPCIEHGHWHELAARLDELRDGDIFLADCDYTHKRGQVWCGLPHRSITGGLSWRMKGRGVYWSAEIHAARRIGARVKLRRAFLYERKCDCQPLGFVRDIFRQRKAMDRIEEGSGIPLKLAINSLYGKFAQRVGAAPYQNHLWAGFITAACRAKVLNAIASAADPRDIIMIATDGIYTTTRLPLELGDELGNWEEAASPKDVLFIKPGIYWELGTKPDALLKVRGMSPEAVRAGKSAVEEAWADYARRIINSDHRAPDGSRIAPRPYPTIDLALNGFIGLRLAFARGALNTAGAWTEALARREAQQGELAGGTTGGTANRRRLGFAWGTKRLDWLITAELHSASGLAVLTAPIAGTGAASAHWKPAPDSQQGKLSDLAQYWAEGQPDFIEPEDDI